jgi:ABC-2 type transport system ATP-binding protein
MKILTGYMAPTFGSAHIAGLDVATDRIQAAEHIGYLPENGPLYPDMTPRAFLAFIGAARGMDAPALRDRIDEMIQLCALTSVADKPIHKLSKGYRQRVGMAQCLLHDPDVFIMDEPTSGLDPNQIRDVRRMIRELGETKTVLLSTHILQEVEAMAERVVFINEGRIVFDGTPAELRESGEDLADAFHRLTGHDNPTHDNPNHAAAAVS